MSAPTTLFDFAVTGSDGAAAPLAAWRGQVALVVNLASRCGFTPQLRGLQALYERFRDDGFVVLGFPCNQFASQTPEDDAAFSGFCRTDYGVTFPLFAKVDVNGEQAAPLFGWLTAAAPGVLGTTAVKWNFTKFLVGRDGLPIGRFAPATSPADLADAVEAALRR